MGGAAGPTLIRVLDMGLGDLLEDVLILLPDWSRQNTVAMQQRAQRARYDIPAWLDERLEQLSASAR